MEQIGRQYHCIVIEFASTNSNSWQERVFWFKSPIETKHFRFGSEEAWKYNDELIFQRAQEIYKQRKEEEERVAAELNKKEELSNWLITLREKNEQKVKCFKAVKKRKFDIMKYNKEN